MTTTATDAHRLLELWEDQQAAYITHRDARFEIMLDVLADTVPDDALVLDLACGPGSIGARVLRRFPVMTCVGVDHDPALLQLARAATPAADADRSSHLDVDLFDPDWAQALQGRRPAAVLSSTALHWLPATVLQRLYRDLADLLPAGGILLNADHLRAETGRPLFQRLSALDDATTQAAARTAGVLDWDRWFALLAAQPGYRDAVEERVRRFAQRPPNPDLSPQFHVDALRAAGFAEAGTIWQHFDDYVVLAAR
jgi:trans-aconitate methyltransferase